MSEMNDKRAGSNELKIMKKSDKISSVSYRDYLDMDTDEEEFGRQGIYSAHICLLLGLNKILKLLILQKRQSQMKNYHWSLINPYLQIENSTLWSV